MHSLIFKAAFSSDGTEGGYRQSLSRVFEPVVQVNIAKIMFLEFLGTME